MRAAIVFLLVSVSAVTTPAAVGWTFIGKNTIGDQYFIDLATLKKGAMSRAWFLTNYAARTKYGDLSSKVLREADCREEKTRILAIRLYTEPMGAGDLSGASDQPLDWSYMTPDSMEESFVRIMCRGNR
jgi:hypothetical protein